MTSLSPVSLNVNGKFSVLIIDNSNNVHLAITDEKFKNHLLKIAKYLTENKILFFWNYKYNLKKSLSKANSDKAKFAIIIGEEEFNKDIFTIKNLNTGNQSQLDINKIIDFLND